MLYAKDVLEKLKEQSGRNSTDYVLERSRANIKAAMIGAGVGLVIGYTRKYNLWVSAMVGAVAVGLIANVVLPKT